VPWAITSHLTATLLLVGDPYPASHFSSRATGTELLHSSPGAVCLLSCTLEILHRTDSRVGGRLETKAFHVAVCSVSQCKTNHKEDWYTHESMQVTHTRAPQHCIRAMPSRSLNLQTLRLLVHIY